jgi:large subunit ribosomal protein L23
MAEEKKEAVAPSRRRNPRPKKAAVKKEAVKAEPVKADDKKAAAPKAEEKKVVFAAPTAHDYDVVFDPHITEKSMALLQNANKVTVKVAANANKTEIKESFQRLYQVKVCDVKVINQRAKAKSRGGRYQGSVSGYKKAVVTLAKGSAVDLFKQ